MPGIWKTDKEVPQTGVLILTSAQCVAACSFRTERLQRPLSMSSCDVTIWARCFYSPVGPGDRAVYGVGLRPLASSDCGFEYRRGHGYVCCTRGVSGCVLLVQRSPTQRGASECHRETSTMRRPRSTEGCCAMQVSFYTCGS